MTFYETAQNAKLNEETIKKPKFYHIDAMLCFYLVALFGLLSNDHPSRPGTANDQLSIIKY